MGGAKVEAEELTEHVSQHWWACFVGLFFKQIWVSLNMLCHSLSQTFSRSTFVTGATFQHFPSVFCLWERLNKLCSVLFGFCWVWMKCVWQWVKKKDRNLNSEGVRQYFSRKIGVRIFYYVLLQLQYLHNFCSFKENLTCRLNVSVKLNLFTNM